MEDNFSFHSIIMLTGKILAHICGTQCLFTQLRKLNNFFYWSVLNQT